MDVEVKLRYSRVFTIEHCGGCVESLYYQIFVEVIVCEFVCEWADIITIILSFASWCYGWDHMGLF